MESPQSLEDRAWTRHLSTATFKWRIHELAVQIAVFSPWKNAKIEGGATVRTVSLSLIGKVKALILEKSRGRCCCGEASGTLRKRKANASQVTTSFSNLFVAFQYRCSFALEAFTLQGTFLQHCRLLWIFQVSDSTFPQRDRDSANSSTTLNFRFLS